MAQAARQVHNSGPSLQNGEEDITDPFGAVVIVVYSYSGLMQALLLDTFLVVI